MKNPDRDGTKRKPPIPLDDHSEIEEWMQRVMPDLNPLVKRLDELIRNTVSGLQYAIKWGKVYYGLPEQGWIIEMVAYDISVNVVFLAGAEFSSPPPSGERGGSRYIKYKSVDEVEGSDIIKWIKEASRIKGWK